MPLPPAITQASVTFGTGYDLMGLDATISGTVVADRRLIWSATGQAIYEKPATVTGSGTALLAFNLPHTDQTGFIDQAGNAVTGWYYTLNAVVDLGGTKIIVVKRFQILSDQINIDLDLVPDGAPTPALTAPTALVTSVNGQTGAVTVAGGGSTDLTPYSTTAQANALYAKRSAAYVTGRAYSVDELVTFNGTLYRITTAYTSSGASLDLTKAVAITSAADLTDYSTTTQMNEAISSAVSQVASAGQVDRVQISSAVTGTFTANLSNYDYFDLTLTGNATLAVTGLAAGRSFTVEVNQGATPRTFTLPAAVTNPSDGVVSSTANSTTTLVFFSDNGTNLRVTKIVDAGAITTAIAGKADTTTVNTALAAKADLSGGKVPIGQIPNIPVANVTGAITSVVETVNTVASSGAAYTIPDVTVATQHAITLTASPVVITFPTAAAGKSFLMQITQDATGARTITWPSGIKWPAGFAPTLSVGAGAVDLVSFVCVGTSWVGLVVALDVR